jgi:hypothetical protein
MILTQASKNNDWKSFNNLDEQKYIFDLFTNTNFQNDDESLLGYYPSQSHDYVLMRFEE